MLIDFVSSHLSHHLRTVALSSDSRFAAAYTSLTPGVITSRAAPSQIPRFPVKGKDSTELHPLFNLAPVSDYDSDCRSLEIEPGASPEEVRQAYLDQTKIWHPDRFSNDIRLQKKAEEKLKQINLAYQRLCGGGPYEPPVLNRSTETVSVRVGCCLCRSPSGAYEKRARYHKALQALDRKNRQPKQQGLSMVPSPEEIASYRDDRVRSRICFRRLAVTT